MLDDALERKLVRISQIREVIARCGAGRPGVHRLIDLLDERTGAATCLSRSHWERGLRELLRLAGIAPDETERRSARLRPGHDVAGGEADRRGRRLGAPPQTLTLRGRPTRDAILATHGWITLRFTARRIRDEPYAVIAEIALMLGRRLEAAERAA